MTLWAWIFGEKVSRETANGVNRELHAAIEDHQKALEAQQRTAEHGSRAAALLQLAAEALATTKRSNGNGDP